MYSGKFPCSLIINKCKKIIQIILFTFCSHSYPNYMYIHLVYFTFSQENYATFAELNSDFIVRFILVWFVIVTKGDRI